MRRAERAIPLCVCLTTLWLSVLTWVPYAGTDVQTHLLSQTWQGPPESVPYPQLPAPIPSNLFPNQGVHHCQYDRLRKLGYSQTRLSPDPLQEDPLLTEMKSGAASPARPLPENSQEHEHGGVDRGAACLFMDTGDPEGPVAAGRG